MYSLRIARLVAIFSSAVHAAILELPFAYDTGRATVAVDIGTPPRAYRFVLDTGSIPTWIHSANCTDCTDYSGYQWTGYGRNISSSARTWGVFDEVDYVSNRIAGFAYTDVMSSANFYTSAHSSPDNGNLAEKWESSFMAVTESDWSYLGADGFMGLGFKLGASANTSTFVEDLMATGKLNDHRFGMYLGGNPDQSDTAPGNAPVTNGSLTVGGSKEEYYMEKETPELITLPLLSPYYQWVVPFSGVSALPSSNTNASSTPPVVVVNHTVIFDTGASAIYAPSSVLPQLYSMLGLNYTDFTMGYRPLCSDMAKLATGVSFDFGTGKTISMSALNLTWPGYTEQQYCWPPFLSSGGTHAWIMGSSFLANVYSIYDFGAWEQENYQPTISLGKLPAVTRRM